MLTSVSVPKDADAEHKRFLIFDNVRSMSFGSQVRTGASATAGSWQRLLWARAQRPLPQALRSAAGQSQMGRGEAAARRSRKGVEDWRHAGGLMGGLPGGLGSEVSPIRSAALSWLAGSRAGGREGGRDGAGGWT